MWHQLTVFKHIATSPSTGINVRRVYSSPALALLVYRLKGGQAMSILLLVVFELWKRNAQLQHSAHRQNPVRNTIPCTFHKISTEIQYIIHCMEIIFKLWCWMLGWRRESYRLCMRSEPMLYAPARDSSALAFALIWAYCRYWKCPEVIIKLIRGQSVATGRISGGDAVISLHTLN